jgi:hypothetical protein
MKLRLDRVLKVDLSALSQDEVMAAGDELPGGLRQGGGVHCQGLGGEVHGVCVWGGAI